MDLYLMRHADAVSGHGDDFARVLSDKGRVQAAKMAELLERMARGQGPMRFVASPYPRAGETARIAAETFGPDAGVTEDERLSPGMTLDNADALILEQSREPGALCLVGHAPDLDRLASHLLGAEGTKVELKKGAVAAFEADRPGMGGAVLCWLATPKMLDAGGTGRYAK